MKRLWKFTTPEPLSGELVRLERNTDEETRSIRADMGRMGIADTARATQYANPRYLTRADTSSGNLTIKLPAPSPDNAGLPFPIVKTSASNTLTLQPLSGLINGAASIAITTIGLHLVYSDGQAYWAKT